MNLFMKLGGFLIIVGALLQAIVFLLSLGDLKSIEADIFFTQGLVLYLGGAILEEVRPKK